MGRLLRTTRRQHLVLGALLAAGLLMPGTAQAAPACAWQLTELPAPEGAVSTGLFGQGGDYLVGEAAIKTTEGVVGRGVVWHDRTSFTLMPVPPAPHSYAFWDVNASGASVGVQYTRTPGRPLRNPIFSPAPGAPVELLPVQSPGGTEAMGINDRGDIYGWSGQGTILWPVEDRSAWRVIYPNVVPNSIDNEGRVLVDNLILQADGTRMPLEVPAGAQWIEPRAIENGVVIGSIKANPTGSADKLVAVWNLDGSVRSVGPAGKGLNVNSAGTTVVDLRNPSDPQDRSVGVWQDGELTMFPDQIAPSGTVGLSEDGVLVGSYSTGTAVDHRAASWQCARG